MTALASPSKDQLAMSLTREKLERFAHVLDALRIDPVTDKGLIAIAAHRIDFYMGDLGSRYPHADGGTFWQTVFGDLITDGQGNWRLSDA